MIRSDNHIHSEFSYDASLKIDDIATTAKEMGLTQIGITDHVNFNDTKFLSDLHASVEGVKKKQELYPFIVLGTELTPVEKPLFDHIAKTHTREGYIPPELPEPYGIELAVDLDTLVSLGVKYAIGAAHWRVDTKERYGELNSTIREWYRQQLWLAADERVTVLGHPWYHGRAIWYEDFSIIPASMNDELLSALLENGKYIECNSHFFTAKTTSEKFRNQYADFLKEALERGIPVTYGSDAHDIYNDTRELTEKYLRAAGFSDGDISPISEDHFYKAK